MLVTLSRTSTNLLAALGALTLSAGVLTGCTPEPAPTPTPTAAFASEEEAFAAAEEVYRAYNEAFNAVDLQDPASFEALYALSSGDFEAADRETLSELHAENLTFTGEMTVTSFEGIDSPPPFEEVVAIVCVDVSASDVVNAAGESVTSATRPDMNPLRVTFVLNENELLIDHANREEQDACVPK